MQDTRSMMQDSASFNRLRRGDSARVGDVGDCGGRNKSFDKLRAYSPSAGSGPAARSVPMTGAAFPSLGLFKTSVVV